MRVPSIPKTPWDVWLRDFRMTTTAGIRLVCFPHAGGSASFYRTLAMSFPSSVSALVVQYPGHEDRIAEPCIDDMHELADQIADMLSAADDLPLTLFGHSMGAAVAFEVARRLMDTAGLVEALLVSGRPAPHRQRETSFHLSGAAELVGELRRLGSTHEAVLTNPRLRDLLVPAIRNDYRLIETYKPESAPALRCPVHAFISDRDSEVTADEAEGWQELTEAKSSVRLFTGDHFYFKADPVPVVHAVIELLST